jgi:hypothetical protein
MVHVRTVKTASGATAVQIVHSNRRGHRDIEHLGSAHSPEQVEALKAVAQQRIEAGQLQLDLLVALDEAVAGGGPLPITGSRMRYLWDALSGVYDLLGFDRAAEGDEVFRQLVLARIIEPTSKEDSIRVIEEAGTPAPSYRTIKRRLSTYATDEWRLRLSTACAARAAVGPATLILYDVTTLYFETDAGDGFREPGFSKERRLEPQITVGLLTDATGFPLTVKAFEGNKAETATIVPTLKEFMTAHRLSDVTVVADAGMISSANMTAIEAAGLSFILAVRIPKVPWVVSEWHKANPGTELPDGLTLTQPWGPGPNETRRDQVIYYQYRADRARRTLRGIDEQVSKAEKAVAGTVPVKRNRFITLRGAEKSVNRELEAKARALAGWKGYITNIDNPTPEFVIDAYHQLWRIEKSFRMSKHDLRARPIYHHKRESIDAHLTIVLAALAITRHLEAATGWSIKKFVRTARRYRTVQIRVGKHTVTAEDPLPTDLRDALSAITRRRTEH